MRILLINTNRYKVPFPVMPVGLCSVAASLEAAGHQVRVLDLCFSVSPGRDIAAAVSSFSPEIAGVGVRNIDTANGIRPAFMLDRIKTDMIIPLKRAFAGPGCAGRGDGRHQRPGAAFVFRLRVCRAGRRRKRDVRVCAAHAGGAEHKRPAGPCYTA